MILVTGATGYIGGRLVPRLLAREARVRLLSRDPRQLASFRVPGVEAVRGDVLAPATLEPALEGVETAYYLVHSLTTRHDDFAERDRRAARHFAAVCAAAGVRRIVYLGGLGDPARSLSRHLASRQEVGAILRAGPVPVTELRAAIIVGAGSASFQIIRDLVDRLPLMICPRWVRSRCEPIGIEQVLDCLVGVLDDTRTVGEILEIGGGDVLTYEEMLRQYGEEVGRRVRIVPVPVLTPRLSSYWLNLVTSVPMSLARPLVDGLRNDVVTRDGRLRAWLRLPRQAYRDQVRRALAEGPGAAPATRWTKAVTSPARAARSGAPRLHDERHEPARASPDMLFAVVRRIGGSTGWYYADWLWRLRGAIDRLFGGVGMRRGRPHPDGLRVGDAVDFWRVEELVPGRRLRLRAEMRLPGVAHLEFAVAPRQPSGALLRQRAEFEPHGVTGRLYWYLLWPLHRLIFRGMARGLARAAEEGMVRLHT